MGMEEKSKIISMTTMLNPLSNNPGFLLNELSKKFQPL